MQTKTGRILLNSLWHNTDNNKYYQFNGEKWVECENHIPRVEEVYPDW